MPPLPRGSVSTGVGAGRVTPVRCQDVGEMRQVGGSFVTKDGFPCEALQEECCTTSRVEDTWIDLKSYDWGLSREHGQMVCAQTVGSLVAGKSSTVT